MAQFYADIQGNRGGASRMGSKSSGITGHIRGWSVGARTTVWYDEDADCDVVSIYKTGGSNGGSIPELIAEFDSRGVIRYTCPKLLEGMFNDRR